MLCCSWRDKEKANKAAKLNKKPLQINISLLIYLNNFFAASRFYF